MLTAPADALGSETTPQARSPERSQLGGVMSGTRLLVEAVEEHAAQRSSGGGEIAGKPVPSAIHQSIATQGRGGPDEDVDPDEGANG